jgi:aspartate racemase
LYATGDLVRETSRANLIYVDRVDNQVKIRGFRIELGEIEARLRSHSAVEEAVVVVQKTPGQDARLAAFVVADVDKVTGKELRQHLAAALPPYMVPAQVVVEKDLPKTPAGKVDRRKLATREVVQEAVNIESVTDDELERQLLSIWSELLKVPVTDTTQSFFELGGNSLVAVQMFTLVEKRLGKSCKVTEFFKNPTVAALRQLIDSHDGTDWKAPRLELAKGQPGALPIFLAPSVTGRAIDYVHLGEALGKQHPVYALQIQGLHDGEELHADLASAATHYANLMQEVQPKGPYAVIGFSAGGIIAMAIAEVLYDRGEKMAFVGVLDSVPPVPSKSPFTSPARFKRLAKTTVGRVQELARAPNAVQHLVARTKSALKRGAAIWLPLPLEYEAKVEGLFVGANVELSEAETQMMQTHLNAIMAHSPKLYPVDLVLFRTHLDPFEGPHEPDLAWSRAVTGKIEIAILPCMHHELLTRDGAPRLAKLMQPYLERLPKRSG